MDRLLQFGNKFVNLGQPRSTCAVGRPVDSQRPVKVQRAQLAQGMGSVVRAVCGKGAQYLVPLDTHGGLGKTDRQVKGPKKEGKGVDTVQRGCMVIRRLHAEHRPAQPGQPGGDPLPHRPCPVGPQDGEAHAVGDVVPGGQLVAQPVDGEFVVPPQPCQAVVGQAAAPHQLGPGVVVIGLLHV